MMGPDVRSVFGNAILGVGISLISKHDPARCMYRSFDWKTLPRDTILFNVSSALGLNYQ